MPFMWEFIVGLLVLSPIFIVIHFAKRETSDFTRDYFKMLRDQQKARKGEYNKIDKDS